LGDERDAQRLCRVALRRIEAYREFEPDDLRAMCDLACCLVEVGDVQGALYWAQQVDDLDDPLTYYVACALARAGEVPLAISHLERTIEAGWSHGGWLNSDKDLDNLRSEAKFRKIEGGVSSVSRMLLHVRCWLTFPVPATSVERLEWFQVRTFRQKCLLHPRLRT
jgi:hypothetical protein